METVLLMFFIGLSVLWAAAHFVLDKKLDKAKDELAVARKKIAVMEAAKDTVKQV